MAHQKKSASNSAKTKRVTLQDIADVAGVHMMTVSDALNGKGRVAPATREKIIQIARDLNYIPNLTARALATGRTGRIAFLSGPLNHPYYANILQHLKHILRQDGYRLLLFIRSSEVPQLLQVIENTEVDGVIGVDVFAFSEEFRDEFSVPCVSIGAFPRTAVDSVVIDLSAGVKQAVNLMFDAGCRRVAYIVTTQRLVFPEESRARAYFEVVRQRGQEPEIIDLKHNEIPGIRRTLTAYLQEKGCPDGLLCQNDDVAMCTYRVLRDLGYRVPDDVLLVGCDGQVFTEFFDPPISTVVQPIQEAADAAWRLLRQRIENPALPHQEITLQAKLRVTESLGPTTHTESA